MGSGSSARDGDLMPPFTHAKPADPQEILESLVALGRARQDGEVFSI